MHPSLIFVPLPIVAPSPMTAPSTEAWSEIVASGKTTEFFNDLYAPRMSSVIRGFVKFQDCLGLYQDAQVAMETLRELAEEIAGRPKAPAQLLLGIGSLIILSSAESTKASDFLRSTSL